jgi:hypothetical protein
VRCNTCCIAGAAFNTFCAVQRHNQPRAARRCTYLNACLPCEITLPLSSLALQVPAAAGQDRAAAPHRPAAA